MAKEQTHTTTMQPITATEIALLNYIRQLGFGVLEYVAVKDGQPTFVKAASQRIELTNEHEREAINAGLRFLTKDGEPCGVPVVSAGSLPVLAAK